MHKIVTCAAVLAVRNEESHIRRVLAAFIGQGIDVVVIDNDSTDGTVNVCQEYLGKGLLFIDRVAWAGAFDLSAQMEAKSRVAQRLDHDWLIHTDADEWMQSPIKGESLLAGISRVSALGYTAINFDEFVFLPAGHESEPSARYEREILHYYFFEPNKIRLMRAWSRGAGLSNISSGGHRLVGAHLNIAPDAFILRHYMVLSQQDAEKKYVGRTFVGTDLAKGWHGNRLQLTPAKLRLPEQRRLKALPAWDSIEFDRSDAKQRHYWEWGDQ